MKDAPKGCCSPARDASAPIKAAQDWQTGASRFFPVRAVQIPGGSAQIGTDAPIFADDGEGPARRKKIKPFQMMETTVTNEAFMHFILDTGYVTEAERFGWSFVFHSDVPKAVGPTEGVLGTEWWRKVDGADWRHLHGPGTGKAWNPAHPAVHVSWNDAEAFAQWCGGRLPTEAEWEHAARGGLGNVRFPWGDQEPDDTEFLPCNIWQGQFPHANTAADGWAGTAPAQSFKPNGFGLYNMAGNVWEWTSEPFRVKSLKKAMKQKMDAMRGFKVLKGGSFLCHKSYCFRYRIAARIGNSPDTSSPHQGFRVVWDM